MKKFWLLNLLPLLMLVGVFTSCSNDDENSNLNGDSLNEIPVTLDIPYPVLSDKNQTWKEGDVLEFNMNDVVNPTNGQKGVSAFLEYKKGGWTLSYDKRLSDLSQKYPTVSGTISYYGRRQQDDTFKTYKVENGTGNYMTCKNNDWKVSFASGKGLFSKETTSNNWNYEQSYEIMVHASLAAQLSDSKYKIDGILDDLISTESIEKDGNYYKYLYAKSVDKSGDGQLSEEIEEYWDGKNYDKSQYTDLDAWIIFWKLVYAKLGWDDSDSYLHNHPEKVDAYLGLFSEWFLNISGTPLADFITWLESYDVNASQKSTRGGNAQPTLAPSSLMNEYGNKDEKSPMQIALKLDIKHYNHEKIGMLSDAPDGLHRGNWMSFLDDNTPLGELIIPACHDQATSNYYGFEYISALETKCQDYEIDQCFFRGARIFDMRLGPDNHFYHGPMKLGGIAEYMNKYMINEKQLGNETLFFDIDGEHLSDDVIGQAKADIITFLDCIDKKLPNRYAAFTPETPIGELRGKVCLIVNNSGYNEIEAVLKERKIPFFHACGGAWEGVCKGVACSFDGNGQMITEEYPYYRNSQSYPDKGGKFNSIVNGVKNYAKALKNSSKPMFAFHSVNNHGGTDNLSFHPSESAKALNVMVSSNFTNYFKESPLGRKPGFWYVDFWGVYTWDKGNTSFRVNGVIISYIIELANFFYYNEDGLKRWNVTGDGWLVKMTNRGNDYEEKLMKNL